MNFAKGRNAFSASQVCKSECVQVPSSLLYRSLDSSIQPANWSSKALPRTVYFVVCYRNMQGPDKGKQHCQQPQKQQPRDSNSSAGSKVNLPEFFVSDRSISSASSVSSAASDLCLPRGTAYIQHSSEQIQAHVPIPHAVDAGVVAATFVAEPADEDPAAAHGDCMIVRVLLVQQKAAPVRHAEKPSTAVSGSKQPKAATTALQRLKTSCKQAASSFTSGFRFITCTCVGQLPDERYAANTADITRSSSCSGANCGLLQSAPINTVLRELLNNSSAVAAEASTGGADCDCLLSAIASVPAEPPEAAGVAEMQAPPGAAAKGQEPYTTGRTQTTTCSGPASSKGIKITTSNSSPAEKKQLGSASSKSAVAAVSTTKLPRVATLAKGNSRRSTNSSGSSSPRPSRTSNSARSISTGEVLVTVTVRATQATITRSNSSNTGTQLSTGTKATGKPPHSRSVSARSAAAAVAVAAQRSVGSTGSGMQGTAGRGQTKAIGSTQQQLLRPRVRSPIGGSSGGSSTCTTPEISPALTAGGLAMQPTSSGSIEPMAAYASSQAAEHAQHLTNHVSSSGLVSAIQHAAAAASGAAEQGQAGPPAAEGAQQIHQQQLVADDAQQQATAEAAAAAASRSTDHPGLSSTAAAATGGTSTSSSSRTTPNDPRRSIIRLQIPSRASTPCPGVDSGSSSSGSKSSTKCVHFDEQQTVVSGTVSTAPYSHVSPLSEQQGCSSRASSKGRSGSRTSSRSGSRSSDSRPSSKGSSRADSQQAAGNHTHNMVPHQQQLAETPAARRSPEFAAADAAAELGEPERAMYADVLGLEAVEGGHQMQQDRLDTWPLHGATGA